MRAARIVAATFFRLVVPILLGPRQREQFPRLRGQVDLVYRDGQFHLYATAQVPTPEPTPVTDFLGVDLGLANLATDSDPDTAPYGGGDVERVRRKHCLQRRRLQRRGTTGARRKARRVGRKEGRFRRHENHRITQQLVSAAQRTGRGIAVEDLDGIRDRVTARAPEARARLSGWSFHQFYHFLAYKAERAGVPVVRVDPAYTSQTCAACGHCCRANRTSQAVFECQACGHKAHADKNAARGPTRSGEFRARAIAKLALELGSPRG